MPSLCISLNMPWHLVSSYGSLLRRWVSWSKRDLAIFSLLRSLDRSSSDFHGSDTSYLLWENRTCLLNSFNTGSQPGGPCHVCLLTLSSRNWLSQIRIYSSKIADGRYSSGLLPLWAQAKGQTISIQTQTVVQLSHQTCQLFQESSPSNRNQDLLRYPPLSPDP